MSVSIVICITFCRNIDMLNCFTFARHYNSRIHEVADARVLSDAYESIDVGEAILIDFNLETDR